MRTSILGFIVSAASWIVCVFWRRIASQRARVEISSFKVVWGPGTPVTL